MEIEAKFRVRDEEAFQRLLGLDSLAGLRLAPVPPVDVGDRYYDTPDGALAAAGMACRVRSEGPRVFGMVKGVGHAEGAIHQRFEQEIELERPLSPAGWPAGELRDLVERLSRGKPLQPLFDLEQQRHRRMASQGGAAAGRAVAEISLDRVVVRHVGTVLDRYLELEAELLPAGSVADLDRLAAHLVEEWGLEPERSSKFERAMALLHLSRSERERGLAHGGAAQRLAEIEPDDLMSEAGRKVMGRQFQKMMTNEPGTRLGQDPEALHDMRVATRRMRAAFRVFGEYYNRNEIKSYEQGLKATGRALGPVRDLDVFMEKVQAYVDTLAPDAQGRLDRLWSILVERREVGRGQMLTYLDQDSYRQFKDEFALFCETEGMASRPVDMEAVEIKPYRVRDVAPAAPRGLVTARTDSGRGPGGFVDRRVTRLFDRCSPRPRVRPALP